MVNTMRNKKDKKGEAKKEATPKKPTPAPLFDEDYEKVAAYEEISATTHFEALKEKDKLEKYKEASKLRKKAADYQKKAAVYHQKYKAEMEKVAKYQAEKAKYKEKENALKEKIKALKRRIVDYQKSMESYTSLKKREAMGMMF